MDFRNLLGKFVVREALAPFLSRTSSIFFPVGLVGLVWATTTAAMTIETITWREHHVVSAIGPVKAGDADRLVTALEDVEVLPHGAKVVLLDSPGGSVAAALEISTLIDELETQIHMVVPDGARCASACASILLIAGDYRTVEPSGLVGQHSCSRGGVQDEACNELLAQHAIQHGVSHGAVKAFVTYVAPEDILWFDREALDCWGILRYPFQAESGFEKSEPCFFQMIKGEFPAAQSAWRVTFYKDGYRAFLRPAFDHLQELEVGLFCDETRPGELFLSMDIAGPSEAIQVAIKDAFVAAQPIIIRDARYRVIDLDGPFSRVLIDLGDENTIPFLTEAEGLIVAFDLYEPYEPIVARTSLGQSRTALLFAANNCINN